MLAVGLRNLDVCRLGKNVYHSTNLCAKYILISAYSHKLIHIILGYMQCIHIYALLSALEFLLISSCPKGGPVLNCKSIITSRIGQ